jgi:hypothetical protein
VRLAALALIALALTGCETSAEKSAKLEHEAKAHAATMPAAKGLSIGRESAAVKVLATTVLHGSEGAAVAVTLRNTSGHALREVPIELTVKDAHGASVYTNAAPGIAHNLTTVSFLPAHGELTWVDDQLPAAAGTLSAAAKLGEAPAAASATPAISTEGVKLFEEPTSGVGAEGNVVNRSAVAQRELVVYVLARRGGAIVAAGRGVVPLANAGAATRFQVFFVGNPQGAQLQASTPPTTFG